MIFNHIVLLLAVFVGIGAGGTLAYTSRRSGAVRSLVVTSIVGAIMSVAALVYTSSRSTNTFFGPMHVAYLILVVGIPLASVMGLAFGGFDSRRPKALLSVGLLLVPLGLYATHIEPFWLRTEHVELVSDSIAIEPVRVVVLSDLQTPEIGEYEREAIAEVVASKPDVVLIAGDYWLKNSSDTVTADLSDLLRQLVAVTPHVFVVDGDTDTIAGLQLVTAGTGAILLDNELTEFTVRGTLVRVLGITLDGDESKLVAPFKQFLAPSASNEADPLRLVVAHRPDAIFRFGAADHFDLLVAGHTHGGQFALPFFGPPVTLSKVPHSVGAGGLHVLDGHNIYVSTGIGRERGRAPQMRFGVRPSFGIIDIVPVAAEAG